MKHKQWLMERNKPISRGTDNNREGNLCLFRQSNTAMRSHYKISIDQLEGKVLYT